MKTIQIVFTCDNCKAQETSDKDIEKPKGWFYSVIDNAHYCVACVKQAIANQTK